ncbi:MAG: carboxymuconolactone decarboxylase family protein [Aeromicrobium sp.]|nr:carboxymuconolactone decarboxylase family protein [Aeromicrobium sp.]
MLTGACHYYDPSDARLSRDLRQAAPKAMKAFADFNIAVFDEEGAALPGKVKELIALAVACVTQCPYCLEAHANKARTLGATEAEVAEALLVAVALSSGAAMSHSRMAMKFFAADAP